MFYLGALTESSLLLKFFFCSPAGGSFFLVSLSFFRSFVLPCRSLPRTIPSSSDPFLTLLLLFLLLLFLLVFLILLILLLFQASSVTSEYFPPTSSLFSLSSAKTLAHNRSSDPSPLLESLLLPPDAPSAVERQLKDTKTLTVMSYNTLSQSHCKTLLHVAGKVSNWQSRRQTLLTTIFSADADVVCLQDVDDFEDWWRPNLSAAGYDSLFHSRTEKKLLRPRQEGVVVAYKRDSFQMFRSGYLDFNDAVLGEEDENLAARAVTDHGAVLVHLQPWEACDDPTAICVCSAMLEETPELEKVRLLQAKYLARELEKFNSDFHLPVILAGTLNTVPGGETYEVLTTGITPRDPLPPRAPRTSSVTATLDRLKGGGAVSASSVVLEWRECEDLDEGVSPPPDGYWISWRIGGNVNLAFKDKK